MLIDHYSLNNVCLDFSITSHYNFSITGLVGSLTWYQIIQNQKPKLLDQIWVTTRTNTTISERDLSSIKPIEEGKKMKSPKTIEIILRTLLNFLVLSVILFSGCENLFRQRIVGNWLSKEDSNVNLTFASDGTFSYRNKQKPKENFTGTYSFIGDDQIKIDPKGGLRGILGYLMGFSGIYKVTFAENQLTLTNEDGKSDVYYKDNISLK